MSDFLVAQNKESGIFAIRGDLDGTKDSADYSEMKQFIGLLIEGEEFLLPIEVMNEIIMIHQMTFVPGSPRFVEGVINLRGRILPAINLRTMMAYPVVEPTQASRIIIVRSDRDEVGLIVDGITYVVTLSPDQIEEQQLTSGKGIELLNGISKRGEQVNGILDIHKVVHTISGRNEADDDASKATT